MNVRKRSIVKVERHLRVKGDWQVMKTLDKKLVLDRTSMESVTYGEKSEYRIKEGFVLSPTTLPITHIYYCLKTSDKQYDEVLNLEGSEVVDNPTAVDTGEHVWVKIKDKHTVHELSDWCDWQTLSRYHDLSNFNERFLDKTPVIMYDFKGLFKEYADNPEVREVLEEFGQTGFNMDEVDLSWYRYTSDGRLVIDEASNEYIFARLPSKTASLEKAPMMWVVPLTGSKDGSPWSPQLAMIEG